jgi:hypothetical protein
MAGNFAQRMKQIADEFNEKKLSENQRITLALEMSRRVEQCANNGRYTVRCYFFDLKQKTGVPLGASCDPILMAMMDVRGISIEFGDDEGTDQRGADSYYVLKW